MSRSRSTDTSSARSAEGWEAGYTGRADSNGTARRAIAFSLSPPGREGRGKSPTENQLALSLTHPQRERELTISHGPLRLMRQNPGAKVAVDGIEGARANQRQ